MSVYLNKLEYPGEVLEVRDTIPNDVHWDLRDHPFLGEIYSTSNDKYYSRWSGKTYRMKRTEKHLDEGHFQGYSFAIDKFTKVGDWVLDPFVGTGTCLIESYLKGRNSIGIELEFTEILQKEIDFILSDYKDPNTEIRVISGDSSKVSELVQTPLNLIVTGFPYPIISGSVTSDKRMRMNNQDDKGYLNKESLGNLRWKGNFLEVMTKTLSSYSRKLICGGRLVTLIKDPINGKKPFFLQKYVMEDFLSKNKNFSFEGWYLHKHAPENFFIRSYQKRYPGIPVPLYQIGIVLKKDEL